MTNPNRYAILFEKRKQKGAYQNMSQAKVDRYKEEKKNRKKNDFVVSTTDDSGRG